MRKRDFAKRGLSAFMALSMIFGNVGTLPSAFAAEVDSPFETEIDEETEAKIPSAEESGGTEESVEVNVKEEVSNEGSVENADSSTKSSDEPSVSVAVDEVEESYVVAVDLGTMNGTVTLSSKNGERKSVSLEKGEDGEIVSVSKDSNGNKIGESAIDENNPFALVSRRDAGEVVKVEAVADEGYVVGFYSVKSDAGGEEKVDFKRDAFTSFSYDLTADADKVVTVYFTEIEDDMEIEESSEKAEETEVETDESESEETEQVESTTETETEEVVEKTTENVSETASEDIETEEVSETEVDAETEETLETEEISEAEEVSETETILKAELESESESESETEAVAEEAESESESEESGITYVPNEPTERPEEGPGSAEEIFKNLQPEKDSIEELPSSIIVWIRDKDFDPKSYVPDFPYSEIADLEYLSDDVDMTVDEGDFEIRYLARMKDDPTYVWTVVQPVETSIKKSMATVKSDYFDKKILLEHEQSDEWTGVVPEFIGDEIEGKDVHVRRGEDFVLQDVDFGYDMNLFRPHVEDDGGFDVDAVGTYKVRYMFDCWEDTNLYWYLTCNVIVEDEAIAAGTTIHLANGEFKASATDENGVESDFAYGSDYFTDKAVASFVVKSAYGIEINPFLKIRVDGEEADENDFVESQELKDNEYVVVMKDGYASDEKAVTIDVDFKDYDEIQSYAQKSDDRRRDDYYDLFYGDDSAEDGMVEIEDENYWDDDDFDDDLLDEDDEEEDEFEIELSADEANFLYAAFDEAEEVETSAEATVLYGSKSKTFRNGKAGSLQNPSDKVTNKANGQAAFRQCDLVLSSSCKKKIKEWVTKLGAKLKSDIPNRITISCSNQDGSHPAWVDLNHGVTLKVTAKNKKKNGVKVWYSLKLEATGHPTYFAPGGMDTQAFKGNKSIGLEGSLSAKVHGKKETDPACLDFAMISGDMNPLYDNLTATYQIFKDDGKGTPATDSKGNNLYIKTDANGNQTNNVSLAAGNYYLLETVAPPNYKLDSTPHKFTVKKETTIPTLYETPNSTLIGHVVKSDLWAIYIGAAGPIGDQDMSPARYLLEYWASGPPLAEEADWEMEYHPDWNGYLDFNNPAYLVDPDPEENRGGILGDASGRWPMGTYRLTEVHPAYGFQAEDYYEGYGVARVDAEVVWPEVFEHRIPETKHVMAKISVVKKDNETKGESQGDASLAGIQFAVRNASISPIDIPDRGSYQPGQEIEAARMTTDANGNATTPIELPVGTYDVYEYATNDSMLKTVDFLMRVEMTAEGDPLNPTMMFTITDANGNVVKKAAYETAPQVAYDNPVRGGVLVPKIDRMLNRAHDHGDANLSGAEYTIVNASQKFVLKKDKTTRVETSSLKNTSSATYDQILAASREQGGKTVAAVITSGRDGIAKTTADELAYGTYYIIETKAPDGYFVNTSWVERVEINENGRMYMTKTNSEQIYRGGVKVQKFDYMRDTNRDHGDANLAGAQFKIVNASLALSMNVEGNEIPTSGATGEPTYAQIIAAASKSTMQTLTTDANGYAETSNQALPYGTYYVVETKAPTGYFLNEQWVGKVVVREDKKMYAVQTIHEGIHSSSTNHTAAEKHDVKNTQNEPNHDFAVRDQIYRGGIILPKYDKELDSNVRQGTSTLRNAEFTIVNVSKASVRMPDDRDVQTAKDAIPANPTWQQVKNAITEDNTAMKIYTNADGSARTGRKDLPYGTYYVIETRASYGYFLDDSFVGKIVIRDDDAFMSLSQTIGDSSFVDVHDNSSDQKETVDQQERRSDISFKKTDIDGTPKAYIPFKISAVRVDPNTGKETVLENHIVIANARGYVDTSSEYKRHTYHMNELDAYVQNDVLTPEGEDLIARTKAGTADADKWGVWFEGNANDGPKDDVRDDFGALYTCYYQVTEIKCRDNEDHQENLLRSGLILMYNNDDDPSKPEGNLYAPMTTNDHKFERDEYLHIVDTEIKMKSSALDEESRSKTVPVRTSVSLRDTVEIQHVSADHHYRLRTKYIDLTNDMRELKIIGTNDPDATVSSDSVWIEKEFQPTAISGTNSTNETVVTSGIVNTMGLQGHKLMAIDYLYEYVPTSDVDNAPYEWLLVAMHPDGVDEDQCLYLPDLRTTARDIFTNSRVGTKSPDDAVYDLIEYDNLSETMVYTLRMKVVDAKTGEELGSGEVGIDSNLGLIWKEKASDDPDDRMKVYSGSEVMKPYYFDSSKFENDQSVVVIESLYRANGRTGELIGEPIYVHDSLLDEKETVRYVDVCTSASDKNTADDVGTDEDEATVYDRVKLSNLVFDDRDEGVTYSYTIKGKLVYQKDFVDADGVSHNAGDVVETLPGTQDVVTVSGDASGTHMSYKYADGSDAVGEVVSHRYGTNVAKTIGGAAGDNSYVEDNTAGIADVEVEMIYKVNSNKLEGGTVVVYEYLYHDSTGANEVEISKHEDITDKGQTVHYPKVRTTAVDDSTKDDVGAVVEDAKIVDTVKLDNLVPGRSYLVSGKLVEQDKGTNENPVPFLVKGKEVTARASIEVTLDGQIVSGNGERTTVTKYDAEKNEVCGTVDLTFEFDGSELEDRTCVVFEDLIHNGVKVATHSDLKDEGQTIHFPKIRTNADDGYTGDRVATVTGTAIIDDVVTYVNLVPGREYTIQGTLMRQDNGEPLIDSAGNEVKASRTFVAGEEGDGIAISEFDDEHHKVSGTATITFTFDASLLEDTTVVAFEDLLHKNVKVTTHSEITDKPQTDHFPKLRTSAFDQHVGDEVGQVAPTVIVDTVRFWNLLIPDVETDGTDEIVYEVSGTLMDKDTGLPFKENGQVVTQKVTLTVHSDGTVTTGNGERCEVHEFSLERGFVNGEVDLTYEIDASELEGKTLVVFEDLYHNKVKVTSHADLSDLAQTIHFPKIRTRAVDSETNDDAGTVASTIEIVDTVSYWNLVIGKKYEIRGTLMNQETGLPVVGQDGRPITARDSFVATRESSEKNKVLNVNEENYVVDGEYEIRFTVDSTVLAGKTVVVFEDLYHNGVKVTSHADITDEKQSVHYPEIHTTALDVETNDHVGSIWGSFINGVRRFLGQRNPDGSEITDVRLARIVDVVELDNLVPGLTYVVSGKLYDVDESKEQGENVPLLIDGKEITQAVTITVTEDGEIKALDGSRTTVTKFDAEKHQVDGTVDLTYLLDSSKIQGKELVVFEKLYHDSTYTSLIVPTTVEEEDLIHRHEDIEDKGQSVSEVEIHTTAVDSQTKNHVGTDPGEETSVSVIEDEVVLSRLVPGMDYTIEGVLVDIGKSDFENERAMFLKADGTLTSDRSKAYKETFSFRADGEDEVHHLNFSLTSDKVQGRTLTVFEDLIHNGVVVSSHPNKDGEGWSEEDFSNQTVYYPTGKTNATDNATGAHSSLAQENRIITDRVYFENLLVGEEYEIEGQLVYQEAFTDANGVAHVAGEPLEGANRTVRFVASEDLASAAYSDSETVEGMNENALVDGLVVRTFANGQKTISGYVSIEFEVDASALAGATLVAFETFRNEGVDVFVHKNLRDLPQTVRIPKIRTRASVLDLDEAAVYDENGNFKKIEIIDTVEYKNLWTAAELAEMKEQGKDVRYLDGTAMGHESPIYVITDDASYVLKGVLMDKETGEPLKNNAGGIYEVYSEPFVPTTHDGTRDVKFVVDAADFAVERETKLENKIVVAFEDLYLGKMPEDATDDNHVAEHHDIDDVEQDIRFPKGRTHATDGQSTVSSEHDEENVTTPHEVDATDSVRVYDDVSFENLHGATKYEVTGKLQVITGYDADGTPSTWEAAKDDSGNEITATATLDTSQYSDDYEASVSGKIRLVFEFSGVNLAGKTTVAFETITRNGIPVMIHADVKDEAQTIYLPKIRTNASDAISGLNEAFAGAETVILDKVVYENLEYGKTYKIRGILHRKSDGAEIEGTETVGTFVAGTDNQFVMRTGTTIGTIEDVRKILNGETTSSEIPTGAPKTIVSPSTGVTGKRASGEITVILPVDATSLAGDTIVAFETLWAQEDEEHWKKVAHHEDLTDEEQSVHVPKIRTKAAIDGKDKKNVVAGGKTTVIDTVEYHNLTPGHKYVLKGELMEKKSGKRTEVTADTEFVPKTADGHAKVKFTFDSTKFAGCELVVFEKLESYETNYDTKTFDNKSQKTYKVAEHADLDDEAQTVTIKKPNPGQPTEKIQTGDIFRYGILILMLAAATLLAALQFGRRKRRTNV